MGIVFGNWKYIVRNLWYVLPFAVVPGALMALSLDYGALSALMHAFFSGDPRVEDFGLIFRSFSFIRIDSWLGAVYSVCAVVAVAVFMTLMFAFVEKHMRIGKRTLSGVFSQLGTFASATLGATLLFLALYELWAVVLSAIVYVVFQLPVVAAYFGMVAAVVAFGFLLVYLVSFVYLFLPCKQVTGFRNYDAFLYSYRLIVKVRWRVVLPMFASLLLIFTAIAGLALLPSYAARLLEALLFCFAFLGFGVRMLTVYFEADKLDREDLLKSYREF